MGSCDGNAHAFAGCVQGDSLRPGMFARQPRWARDRYAGTLSARGRGTLLTDFLWYAGDVRVMRNVRP